MAIDGTGVSTDVKITDLLEAGLHFGHQTKRWNPKMKRYIFDERNGIYIIDLAKSLVLLKEAQKFLYDTVSRGRKVLFVGTKKQAQDPLREIADKLSQPYMVHRWLGGTLTNASTVRRSVSRMRALQGMTDPETGEIKASSKKEGARLRREVVKLDRNLGGIADMDQLPGALFIVDVNREHIAVEEARRLNIPVVALVDTNCDPDPIDFPIPGNDDAIRAIRVIVNLLGETIQHAANEYARFAAEEARRRAEEEAEARARAEAAEEAARKARAEALAKARAEEAARKARAAEEAARKEAEAAEESARQEAEAAEESARQEAEAAVAPPPEAEPAPAPEAAPEQTPPPAEEPTQS